MAFQIENFIALRPYLYHHTAVENLHGLMETRKLTSASRLSNSRKLAYRPYAAKVTNGRSQFWLQTQGVLHEANIDFLAGYDFQSLIDRLNSLVFFWPGDASGPIPAGQNHLRGNKWPSNSVSLRVPSREVISSNLPLFCAYNSGSPRCSGGRKSPRGTETFLPSSLFERTAGRAVEVVFEDCIDLPQSTEVFDELRRSWRPLFTDRKIA